MWPHLLCSSSLFLCAWLMLIWYLNCSLIFLRWIYCLKCDITWDSSFYMGCVVVQIQLPAISVFYRNIIYLYDYVEVYSFSDRAFSIPVLSGWIYNLVLYCNQVQLFLICCSSSYFCPLVCVSKSMDTYFSYDSYRPFNHFCEIL